MDVSVAPGKYVVAVSGGVDSIVLLNVLSKMPELDIVVAHFDHGIRRDSAKDREFVYRLAASHGFPFEYANGKLGSNASEAIARIKRYDFLENVKQKYHADAIMTAHHKDDVLETACINILRGTGRRGLSSLSSDIVVRPLLSYTKLQILDYAQRNNLQWREDSTNISHKYLRNRIRSVLQTADHEIKQKIEVMIAENYARNQEIDALLEEVFKFSYDEETKSISQSFFINLPYNISCEVLVFWLRKNYIEFDRKNIQLLTVGLKTGRAGIKLDIAKNWYFYLSGKQISLEASSSV